MSKIQKILKEIDELLSNNSEEMTHGIKRAFRNLNKEGKLYSNHLNSSANFQLDKIKSKLATGNVQIGGGKHLKENFLNIDINHPADLIWDVREGLPLEDNTANFIFSEHFLEHVDYHKSVKKIIAESYRILNTGGKIVIGVPDSELMINAYTKRDAEFYNTLIQSWYSARDNLDHFNTYIDLMNYHFRDQDDDDNFTPHLWSFDKEKLFDLLKSAGFSEFGIWKFDDSIAYKKREFGSIYVYGIK